VETASRRRKENLLEPLLASRTALATSLMRALHTRADPAPILIDPWGDRLVSDSTRAAIRQRALAAMTPEAQVVAADSPRSIVDDWLRGSAAYATVITRSRYAEDALHAAVSGGVRQYVLVGAGFDSYALRTPAAARHVEIFEVDHPATQGLKRQRLAECGVTVPDSVHFLAADLADETLDAVLSRSAFRPAEPAFFSWLGVTMYLPREANLATLAAVARCARAGSEIVFTYIDQEAFRSDPGSEGGSLAALQQSVKSVGEPFLSGFDPHALAQELLAVGLELQEDLADADLVQRYDAHGANGLRPASRSRIARARVAGRRGFGRRSA